MAAARNAYDRDAWATLLQVDRDIAVAAAHLAQFGQQFVDDLAESYLAIGEKRYLSAIVAKIQRQAEDEAANVSDQNPGTIDTNGANDNAYRAERYAPDFDAGKWEQLASSDLDVAAAIAEVGRFGSNYVADLAASYQAIGEKFYLRRIVDTIVTEARADLANASKMKAAGSTLAASTSSAQSNSKDRPTSSPWNGRLEPGEQQSSLRDRQPVTNSVSPRPDHKSSYLLGIGALGLLSFLLVGAAALTFYEYSIFRSAAGDANKLEAYARECHFCVFKGHANSEASRLRTVTAEALSFEVSRGDINSLQAYLSACRVCASSTAARDEINRLKQQAAEAEAAREREAIVRDQASRQMDQAAEAEAVREREAAIRDQATRQMQQAADADAAQQRAAELAADQAQFYAARGDVNRLRAYVAACTGCAYRAAAEAALSELLRHVTWRVTNNTSLSLELQYFSMTRLGVRWPGSNQVWPMSPGQTSDFPLNCQTGEQICYGAAAPYRTEMWGVGGFGNLGCRNCCITCDGTVHAFNLVTDGGGPNE